jgi:hypothetical protein
MYRMRRTNWKTVSTLVTMIAFVGCNESSVSAPETASVAPAPMMLAPEGRPQLSLNGGSPQNTSTDFTVGPWGGVFLAGNHAVVFPAQSICDPAKSSYGPGTWDSPCEPLKSSLRIHAEVRTLNGRTWVDFTPALRFVPSTNAAHWVWMYMYTPTAEDASDLSKFNILYSSEIGGPSVDESADDASLRTYVDTRQGISARRIKHFSGYNSMGFACDPATEPGCTE